MFLNLVHKHDFSNLITDHWSLERIYASTNTRRISGCVSGDGVNGRESVSGDPDGFGS